MDKYLAELYQTAQVDETDFEKLAAAEMAEGLAQENGVDLSKMSPDQIEALAQEVLSGDEQQAAPAQEEEQEQTQEQAAGDEPSEEQVKMAEADFAGRVMAHAYWQELKGIQKEAASAGEVAKQVGKNALEHGKSMASKIHKGAKRLGAHLTPKPVAKEVAERSRKAGEEAHKASGSWNATRHGKEDAGKNIRRLHAAVGYGAAGTGAAATGLAAKKAFGKDKKSEAEMPAFEALVDKRACEILEANGYNPETLQKIEEQASEKTAAPADQLDALSNMVEQKAWELLGQHGFKQAEEQEQAAEETEQEQK